MLRRLTGQDFGADAARWGEWLRANRWVYHAPPDDPRLTSRVERPVVPGAVVEMGPNLDCSVRLDSGDVVRALIPRRTARLMFRVVPGDRVWAQACGEGPFVVLGHERVRA
jgi:translation initiation factor IF-1